MTLRDSEASILRQDHDMGGRVDVTGFESCTVQYERHRHCEAARMGRAEQLFGIRTLALLEARVERIRALERPVSEVDLALPVRDASFPTCVCLACCHDSSFAPAVLEPTGTSTTKPSAKLDNGSQAFLTRRASAQRAMDTWLRGCEQQISRLPAAGHFERVGPIVDGSIGNATAGAIAANAESDSRRRLTPMRIVTSLQSEINLVLDRTRADTAT